MAETAPVETTKTIIKRNGIKRPDAGSVTGALWDIADQLSEANGRPATRKEVTDQYMTSQPGANLATANTQYARWVAYHGVSDILKEQRKADTEARKAAALAAKEAAKAVKSDEQVAKEAEKARKAQERADAKAAKEAEKARKAQERADAKAAKEAEKAAAKAAKAEPAAE